MRILTRRKYLRRHNLDIVYEWEDVLSKTCFADFTYPSMRAIYKGVDY